MKDNWAVLVTTLLIFAKLLYFQSRIEYYDVGTGYSRTLIASSLITAAVVTVWTVFLAYRKKIIANFVVACLASLVILIDSVYLRFFKNLPSIDAVFYINQVESVGDSVNNLFQLKDLLFVADIFIALFLVVCLVRNSKWKALKSGHAGSNGGFGLICSFLVITALAACIIHDRSEIQRLAKAAYDNRMIAVRYGALGYHMINMYSFVLNHTRRLSPDEIGQVINWVEKNKTGKFEANESTGVAKNKNVIIIQLEAVGNLVINRKADGQELTPNLNRLAKESHYFDNFYFILGLGNTSDSDFTTNTSFYPLYNSSVFVTYGRDNFTSLPAELKKAGYSANAYHAFNRGFWNRDVAFRSLGYDKFYAADNYPPGQKVVMGLNDRDFFRKTADYMKSARKPSLSYLITLSNHYPYNIPDELAALKLDKNRYAKGVYNYYRSVNYTDAALGMFFDELRQQGLWDDSLIVVYGDHFATIDGADNPEVARSLGLSGKFTPKDSLDSKKIPLFIKMPGRNEPATHHEPGSQIDIMPTILNLTGIQTNAPMFGRDLFGSRPPYFSSILYFGNGVIMDRERIYFDGSDRDSANGTCYAAADTWQIMNTAECSALLTRRNEETDFSGKIITHNLFGKLRAGLK